MLRPWLYLTVSLERKYARVCESARGLRAEGLRADEGLDDSSPELVVLCILARLPTCRPAVFACLFCIYYLNS